MAKVVMTEKEKRAAAVRFARASVQLEGFKPSAEDLRLDALYVEGKISAVELRNQVLARYRK